MRKLLIFLLTAFLLPNPLEANWFGKYNSRYEANEACEKWMMQGFKYTFKIIGWKGSPSIEAIIPVDDKAANKYYEDIFAANEENYYLVIKTESVFSRSCLEEKETNQFIGRVKSCLKNKEYSEAEWGKLFRSKSCEKRKYFKY